MWSCNNQPKKGNSLSQTVPASTGSVELVHGSQCNFTCRALAGQAQCHCQLWVQTHKWQQRLAIEQGVFLSPSADSRSFFSRPVCILPEHTTGHLLQLEGRPSSVCDRCFRSRLIRPQTILLPSICTDREMLTEDQEWQRSLCSVNSTNLASSGMVSSSSEHVDRPPTASTESPRSPEESSRGESSADTAESPVSGCIDSIRKSLSEKGVSQQLSSGHHGEKAPSRLMNQHGRGGLAGVVQGRRILEFLKEMYNENKDHSTINSYCSAISTFCDGVPVGQHVMVTRLMQGTSNTRPSKPRYTTVWDVKIVLNYIKNMRPSKELRLMELSAKLVMWNVVHLIYVHQNKTQTLCLSAVWSHISKSRPVQFLDGSDTWCKWVTLTCPLSNLTQPELRPHQQQPNWGSPSKILWRWPTGPRNCP